MLGRRRQFSIMPIRLILITFGGFCLVKSSAFVCSVCEVTPLPDFQNKRVSEGVLWTKTDMTSRAECAARCSLFRVIKSFGYKEASTECVAYTVPLTTPAAMTYASESGFNVYSTCAPDSPNFGTCSSSCSGTNVVCNNGYCVCDIMYVKRGSSCVQDCGGSGYGSGFTIFHDKVLSGYNDRTVSSIQTIDACVSLCQVESGFTCITADYDHTTKTCYLSKSAWYDVPASSAVGSTTYHQVIRNCA